MQRFDGGTISLFNHVPLLTAFTSAYAMKKEKKEKLRKQQKAPHIN